MGQLLYDKASLVNIPSRYKEGKLYNIKPSNADFEFERGTIGTRVNSEGKTEHAGTGSELIVNGAFDTDSDWSYNTLDWEIVGGKATSFGNNFKSIVPSNINIEIGKTYLVTFEILEYVSGNELRFRDGSTVVFSSNKVGVHTFFFVAATTQVGFQSGDGFEGSIDNVSIKEIHLDTPRIDYSSGEGALLLEPSRTNNIRSSEIDDYDFGWRAKGGNLNVQGMSKTASYDPKLGSLVFTISESDQNEQHRIFSGSVYETPFSGTKTHAISFLIKGDGIRYIRPYNISGFIDLQDGTNTVEQHVATDPDVISFKSEMKSNGYVKIEYVITHTNTTVTAPKYIILFAMEQNSDQNATSYLGDPNRSVKISQLQIEEGSYPTSYIPGTGTLITRNADICTGGGNADTFNDSEGTLYLEYEPEKDLQMVTLSDGTPAEAIWIYLINGGANLSIYVNSGGGQVASINCGTYESITANSSVIKVAATYKTNQFKAFVNGSLIATDPSGATPTGLNTIEFKYPTSSAYNTKANIKSLVYFPEALEDHELERLTSPTPLHASSFEDLANNNGYTIL